MQVPPEREPDRGASGPDAAELFAALSRLPPRSSQILAYRVLEARSAAECARLYGTEEPAIAIHAFRAARLLMTALSSPTKRVLLPSDDPALPADEERRRARELAQALDGSVASDDLSAVLLRARALAPEIRRIAEANAQAAAASPAHRRAEWLRRLAIAAFVVLALWLYLRQR